MKTQAAVAWKAGQPLTIETVDPVSYTHLTLPTTERV